MALPMQKARFTYADYLARDEHDRAELLDGEPVLMAPPSRLHQEISVELVRQIANNCHPTGCGSMRYDTGFMRRA